MLVGGIFMEKKVLARVIMLAISLALGIAMIVLNYLGEPITNMETIVGVSILCLTFAGLSTVDTESF